MGALGEHLGLLHPHFSYFYGTNIVWICLKQGFFPPESQHQPVLYTCSAALVSLYPCNSGCFTPLFAFTPSSIPSAMSRPPPALCVTVNLSYLLIRPIWADFSMPVSLATPVNWRQRDFCWVLGCVHVCLVAQLCLTLQPHGLQPARLLCPWDFPGKNTGVGCHFLLQGIFPTQGLNLCLLHLLHWQVILYHWATLGSLPLAIPPLQSKRFSRELSSRPQLVFLRSLKSKLQENNLISTSVRLQFSSCRHRDLESHRSRVMLKGVTRKAQTEGGSNISSRHGDGLSRCHSCHTCPPEPALWLSVWIHPEITQDHLLFFF